MRLFAIMAAALVLAVSSVMPVTVLAADVFWNFQNNTGSSVHYKIYSDTRRGHQWPGGNDVYALPPFGSGQSPISCHQGEKICYGAWYEGNKQYGWGAKANINNGCVDCCITCDDGWQLTTPLDP